MDRITDWYQSLVPSSFNLSLFLLVILVGMWVASLASNMKIWPPLMRLFGELFGGLLYGVLLSLALINHSHAGVLTLGSLTLGVMLVLHAEPPNKIPRLLAVVVAMAVALYIYWHEWGTFNFLFRAMIEDFL